MVQTRNKDIIFPTKNTTEKVNIKFEKPKELKMKNIKITDIKLSLKRVVEHSAKRECILCGKNLDKDIGVNKWHIPLCKHHRKMYLRETN